MAPAAAAAACVHGRPRQPGHRVRGGSATRPLLRAVALYLGDPDRNDPDLPDDRLLCRRPAGRSSPRRSAPVSDRRRGRAAHGGHPNRLPANPVAGANRLYPALGGPGAGLADLRHRLVRSTRDSAGDGLALRDPAPHPPARNGGQCRRRGLRAVHPGQHPGNLYPGVLADSHVWDPTHHLHPGLCARRDLGCGSPGRRPPAPLPASPGRDRGVGAL